MINNLLTVKELSSFLHVHPKTIYRWTGERKLPFLKVNDKVRFRRKDIETWIDNNSKKYISEINFFPAIDSLKTYDKMLLKGRSALRNKNSKRWNYGFGSIYIRKTKQGIERWYIDFIDEQGKRVQKLVKNAKSREEAVIALQSNVYQIFSKQHNLKTEKEKIEFKEFAKIYIENYAKVKKKSWKSDYSFLSAHLIPYFKGNQLDEITQLQVEKYIAMRIEDEVTKSTINRELACLRKMLNKAIDWGYGDDNPVSRVKFFSEKDNLIERILTEDEERLLLKLSPEQLKSIIIFAIHTGMRKSEILSMKWKNIDLEKREIKVDNTKSGKSRIVPINEELYVELLELKRKSGNSIWLFQNPKTENPLKDVKRSFKEACRKAGIQDLRFHDFRHTFASRLIEKGVDIITVKDLLGHSTVKITERYTHSNRNQKRNAVELLSGKKPKNRENLLHICDMEKDSPKKYPVTRFISMN